MYYASIPAVADDKIVEPLAMGMMGMSAAEECRR
jgi:hypothetical protein